MKTYPITDKRNQAFYPVIACLLICLALFILSIVSENVGPAGVGAMSFSLSILLVCAGIACPSFLLTRYKVRIAPEGIQWILFDRLRYSLSWEECERIEYFEAKDPLFDARFIFFSTSKHDIAANYFSCPAKWCRLPFPGKNGAYVQYSEETDRLVTQFAGKKSLKSYSKPYIPEEKADDEKPRKYPRARRICLGVCCLIFLTLLVSNLLNKEKAVMIIVEAACALYFGLSFINSFKEHKKDMLV